MRTRQHKRRMKLPNGYGSIKYLGTGRRRPYAVYPPVTEWTPTAPITPPALGYCETWEAAYELLAEYNLQKAGRIRTARGTFIDRLPTFAEVYKQCQDEDRVIASKQVSKSTEESRVFAFQHLSDIHNMPINQITYDDMQKILNDTPLQHSSLNAMLSVLHRTFKYALRHEIIDRDASALLINPKKNIHAEKEPFTDAEISALWEHRHENTPRMLLILIFTGFRFSAFYDMSVNLEEAYFQGGVKTAAGKNRIVPILPELLPLVREVCPRSGEHIDFYNCTAAAFRNRVKDCCDSLKLQKHTPHDCRHTFSALCERFGVRENDRKRLLGHSFQNDITNAVYGHRTLEDLRQEIEKISVSFIVDKET